MNPLRDNYPIVCLVAVWWGFSPREWKILEARKMLENAADCHTSTVRGGSLRLLAICSIFQNQIYDKVYREKETQKT
jgi:hypothetical protein